MSEHTKEPWEAVTDCPGKCCWDIQPVGGNAPWDRINGPEMSEADARRIVACVNACAGVPSEILQSWINPPAGQMGLPHGPWHRHLIGLSAQHAKLVKLLEAWLAIDDWTDDSIAPPELISETKATLVELDASVPGKADA